MKFSKPAKRVALVSLRAGGPTIDDLLTVKLSPKVRWLKQGIGFGDVALHPAEPLLSFYQRLKLPDFFRHFDLKSIREDGLENLQKVGDDADGHEYVFGVHSQRFYALWHGQPSFAPVAGTTKEFIQWYIRKRSDHLQGCPWEVFSTDEFQWKAVWHRDQVDPAPLLERARQVASWTREYVSPLGFELFSEDEEIDLRFKKEHRGHNSNFDIKSVRKVRRVETLLKWLEKQDFGEVWH